MLFQFMYNKVTSFVYIFIGNNLADPIECSLEPIVACFCKCSLINGESTLVYSSVISLYVEMNGPRFSWTNCYYFIKNPILFCMRIQLINYNVQNWNWNTIFVWKLKPSPVSTKKGKREIDSVFYRIYICHFSCKTSCPILKFHYSAIAAICFARKKFRIWQNNEAALKKSDNSCINFFQEIY